VDGTSLAYVGIASIEVSPATKSRNAGISIRQTSRRKYVDPGPYPGGPKAVLLGCIAAAASLSSDNEKIFNAKSLFLDYLPPNITIR
jgi:hypothetical protein